MCYSNIHFYFFFAFIAGIVLGAKKLIFFPLAPALSILVLILAFLCIGRRRETLFSVALCAFFVFLGVLYQAPYTAYSLDRFLSQERRYALSVVSIPKETHRAKTYFATVHAVDSIPIKARVYVKDLTKAFVEYRSFYRVQGTVSRRTYKDRIFYTLWIKPNAQRTTLEGSLFSSVIQRTSIFLIHSFKTYLSPDAYQFLSAVLLGRRELLPRNVRSAFIEAGAAHLLAISGLHLGLLGGIILVVLKLFRIPYRARLVSSVVFLVLYTFVSGLAAATVRACIMYVVFCMSFFLKRRLHPFNTLGLSGLISLMMHPLWIFNIGFQFSYVSVAALIIGNRIFPFTHTICHRAKAYIKNIIKASVIVTIALFPLSLFYFGRATLFGIVSNVVLIPLFTLVLAVSVVFLGCIAFLPLAEFIGGALSVLVFLFLRIVFFLSQCSSF